jgi:hypothetical protein
MNSSHVIIVSEGTCELRIFIDQHAWEPFQASRYDTGRQLHQDMSVPGLATRQGEYRNRTSRCLEMPSTLQNETANPGQPVSNVAWCDLLAARRDAMHLSEVRRQWAGSLGFGRVSVLSVFQIRSDRKLQQRRSCPKRGCRGQEGAYAAGA